MRVKQTKTHMKPQLKTEVAQKAVLSRIDNRTQFGGRKAVKLKKLLIFLDEARINLKEFDKQTLIFNDIRKTTIDSFCRFSDRNYITNTMILHWFRKDGTPLDVQAMNMTENYGLPVTEEDLCEFIICHENGCASFNKYAHLQFIKNEIKKITGFNCTDNLIRFLNRKFNLVQSFYPVLNDTPF